nr:MAG TPA: terminase small subunit [Caudoviricetes sp.]
MAGRLPSITPDKKLHRSNEELRDRNEETPIYQRQEFKMPRTLTKEERKVWKFLVQVFRETVNCRVSDADVDMMVLYCRAKVATDEADAALKEDPRAYLVYECGEDKDGNPKYVLKANPNIKKRNDNAALCIRLADQLGLSPQARARAGLKAANAKRKDDPFRKMMQRKDD